MRVAVAYFDVLLAEFNVELAESQKVAVVRAARAGEAQFRGRRRDDHRHQRGPGEVRLDRRAGDRRAQRTRQQRARRCAPSSAVSRATLKRVGPGFEPALPEPERARLLGRPRAGGKPRGQDRRIQLRHRDARSRPGSAPATIRRSIWSAATRCRRAADRSNIEQQSDSRQAQIGVQLNVPIYRAASSTPKCARRSRCRTIARQNLEVARRVALFNAQTGFTGVEQRRRVGEGVRAGASRSAQVAYESNRLGQEVGVRTNLDVLNSQQNVFQTRRDLAQSLFQLPDRRAAAQERRSGTLSEQDLEEINRQLQG